MTRNHPPIASTDATDHGTMHPGLWLAFGDINGQDFWRNRGRIDHVRFTESPQAEKERLTFATECRLLASDGATLGSLSNRFTLIALAETWTRFRRFGTDHRRPQPRSRLRRGEGRESLSLNLTCYWHHLRPAWSAPVLQCPITIEALKAAELAHNGRSSYRSQSFRDGKELEGLHGGQRAGRGQNRFPRLIESDAGA